MSRKIYNNRDKGGAYMSNGIYSEIKKRIELSDGGTVFVTSDFADLATITTVRKCLGRQVKEKTIRRILDGVDVYKRQSCSNVYRDIKVTKRRIYKNKSESF